MSSSGSRDRGTGPGLATTNRADTNKTKFIVITGGTLSGLGKGTTISSLGVCLKALGVHVTSVKIDPYLNVDAGTMSPFEHGECFVLDDGSETDLDLGNYERMLGTPLTRDSCITTGKLYSEVMEKERRGDYLGKTVQIVPHVTDHLVTMLMRAADTEYNGKKPGVVLIEVGGTVGDLESMVFLESLARLRGKMGPGRMTLVHLGYVPMLYGEQKTKPTQAGYRELIKTGHHPNYIMLRCTEEVSPENLAKIAVHANLNPDRVISVHDVPNILQVASLLFKAGIAQQIVEDLQLVQGTPEFTMEQWMLVADKYHLPKPKQLRLAVVGKYNGDGVCGQNDTYLSLINAIRAAAEIRDTQVEVVWLDAEEVENIPTAIKACDCVIIPGGFGNRGTEGKIKAVQVCREEKIPILGICLGFQMMAIEFARNILGQKDAHSEEMEPDAEHKPVVFMPETRHESNLGGTMVLGTRRTVLREGSIASEIYGGAADAHERHRHRYEINPEYQPLLEKAGYACSGMDEFNERVHMLELPRESHPFFVGMQSHPEFKSRILTPAPVFCALIDAAIKNKESKA